MTIAASVQSYLNRDGVRYEMITHERTWTASQRTRRAHSGWPTGEMRHAAGQPGIPDGRGSCHGGKSISNVRKGRLLDVRESTSPSGFTIQPWPP